MCTLSFLPQTGGDFNLVSNRDESPMRETLLPAIHKIDEVDCLFPKDALAGGSWIGVSDKKRMVCLLNGGFQRHKMGTFGRSRGLLVLDLLTSDNASGFLEGLSLDGVEPFTVVTLDWEEELALFECVWDGANKHMQDLEIAPRIWSSRQLYTPEVAANREDWFQEFLEKGQTDLNSQLYFHKTAGNGDAENDLVMNRGFVRTKSMTSIEKKIGRVQFRYEEIPDGAITHHYF